MATPARVPRPVAIALLTLAIGAAPALAQEPQHSVDDLAKQTQNPVANLITIPLQFNFNTGGDLAERTFFNLNVQPVIPFALSQNWHVIARTIVPINSAPGPDGTRYSGVGDIQEQIFFTPAKSGSLVWGVGPVLSFPTATSTAFETGTWALGATGVVVKTTGPFVLGGLVSQFWPMSDAGGEPETDLLTIQPFVNYNMGRGWALGFSPVITANWDASDGNEWTVPIGGGLTRTTVFNRRPMNVGLQYYYNVKHPDGTAGQQLRLVLSLIYPAGKG